MFDVESKRIFFSRNVTFDELIPTKKLIESPTSPLAVFPEDSELAEPINQTPDHTPPVAPDVQPNPAIRPELVHPEPEIRRLLEFVEHRIGKVIGIIVVILSGRRV